MVPSISDITTCHSEGEDGDLIVTLAYLVSVTPQVDAAGTPASALEGCGHAELDFIMSRL